MCRPPMEERECFPNLGISYTGEPASLLLRQQRDVTPERLDKQDFGEFGEDGFCSGLAVPRVWAAVVETHRQPDGSIALPESLWPYFRGARSIGP